MNIRNILDSQKEFYNSEKTRDISFRMKSLEKLEKEIKRRMPDIFDAIKKDLNKSEPEAYLTEVGLVLEEIKTMKKKMAKWQKTRKKIAPFTHFPSSSYVYREPYGNVLILAPWNYPFQLALLPLVGAIAGGNTAVVKPSRSSMYTSKVISEILGAIYEQEYICCVDTESTYDEILDAPYDLIFFTGSPRVGKTVMTSAAKYLTPTVLELGGKSPCIVEKSANLDIAAKRIAWGRFLNAGQTCVSPDYVVVDETIKETFLEKLKANIKKMYADAMTNPDYVHMINERRFDAVAELIEDGKEIWGGRTDRETLCIEPTLVCDADWEDKIMEDEIFGPVLPIISYNSIDEIKAKIKARPRPLALYIFSNDKKITEDVLKNLHFGGGCVNDVIMHVANNRIPFGGVGNSGMGSYHGKYSYETFTRGKGVEKAKNYFDMPFRYPPYTEKKFSLVKKLMK